MPADKTLWVDEQFVTQCNACHTDFSFFLRKHHCRHCGQVFCYKCLTLFDVPEGDAVKVCFECHRIMENALHQSVVSFPKSPPASSAVVAAKAGKREAEGTGGESRETGRSNAGSRLHPLLTRDTHWESEEDLSVAYGVAKPLRQSWTPLKPAPVPPEGLPVLSSSAHAVPDVGVSDSCAWTEGALFALVSGDASGAELPQPPIGVSFFHRGTEHGGDTRVDCHDWLTRVATVNDRLTKWSVSRLARVLKEHAVAAPSVRPAARALHGVVARAVRRTLIGLGRSVGDQVLVVPVEDGHVEESGLIEGIALRQCVPSKRMPTLVSFPRILLLGGEFVSALRPSQNIQEYVAAREGHYEKLFHRIKLWKPDVVVVESEMHYSLQERIAAHGGMSLLLNVGVEALKRIAAGTGARIISSLQYVSIADLSDETPLGMCESFSVRRYGRCRLSVFAGLETPLYSTIVLRGAPTEAALARDVLAHVNETYHEVLKARFFLEMPACTHPWYNGEGEEEEEEEEGGEAPLFLAVKKVTKDGKGYSQSLVRYSNTAAPQEVSPTVIQYLLKRCEEHQQQLQRSERSPKGEAYFRDGKRVVVTVSPADRSAVAAATAVPSIGERVLSEMQVISHRIDQGAVPFREPILPSALSAEWPFVLSVAFESCDVVTRLDSSFFLNLSFADLLSILFGPEGSSPDAVEVTSISFSLTTVAQKVYSVSFDVCCAPVSTLALPGSATSGSLETVETDNTSSITEDVSNDDTATSKMYGEGEVADLAKDLSELVAFMSETAAHDAFLRGLLAEKDLGKQAGAVVAEFSLSAPGSGGGVNSRSSSSPCTKGPGDADSATATPRLESTRKALCEAASALLSTVETQYVSPGTSNNKSSTSSLAGEIYSLRANKVMPLVQQMRKWFVERAYAWEEEHSLKRLPAPLPFPPCLENDAYAFVAGGAALQQPIRPAEPSSLLALAMRLFLEEEEREEEADKGKEERGESAPSYVKVDRTAGSAKFTFTRVTNAAGTALSGFSVELLFPAEFQRFYVASHRRKAACFIRSLSRCSPFKSDGGKTKSTFFVTGDQLFLLKSVKPLEYNHFRSLGPQYFEHFGTGEKSALARFFGMCSLQGSPKRSISTSYYAAVSSAAGGGGAAAGGAGGVNGAITNAEARYFAVMDNIQFDSDQSKPVFDLKGSQRNRTAAQGHRVLLDTDLLQRIDNSWDFFLCSVESKRSLMAALERDTSLLMAHSIMDYSLLVCADARGGRVIDIGIVDYLHPYTGVKVLESKVKSGLDTMLGGGGGADPTIIDPRSYRSRFLRWMDMYFCSIPTPSSL